MSANLSMTEFNNTTHPPIIRSQKERVENKRLTEAIEQSLWKSYNPVVLVGIVMKEDVSKD